MEETKKRAPIGLDEIRAASAELRRWRRNRASFDSRVKEEEEFFRLRATPKAHKNAEGEVFCPSSAWLLNTVLQKHADMMENIPSATCLPREPQDEADAAALSAMLPVVLERCDFEDTYSDNMWFKLKHGMCAYGVFWNNEVENGLGDVDVRGVDVRNLYWQPGIKRIQDSHAVYYVQAMRRDALQAAFPHYNGQGASGASMGLGTIPEEGESVAVVDWYYKKRLPSGRCVLHYCKFTGECLLFASENEAGYENGWYDHGQYPFVLDMLYPIDGTCQGFGIIALARDPQGYIDRVDRNLLEYMDWATRVRYFCKRNTGMSEAEFSDLSRRIVEVDGDLDEERVRQITVAGLDPFWLELKESKIAELKETTANRDVLQGVPDGGVTAAAAIKALQEAGNKTMRDMVAASYRAFVQLVRLVVECMRQFYTEERCFRILGTDGTYRYLNWSNAGIAQTQIGTLPDGTACYRRPIFDIDVRAEKKDPYTRLSHNEMMMELYRMGVFSADHADSAGILLENMEFSGVARLRDKLAALAASERRD